MTLVTCALVGRDVLSSKMPTLRTSTHIALLCVTTVYLSTVEGFNIPTKDASHSEFDQEDVTLKLLEELLPEQRYKQNQIDIKALGKLLEQITDNVKHKRDLREDSIGSVKDFLSKLNSYINKDKRNNDYKKRDNCRAFGPPGSNCKKNKFRRNLRFGNFDQSRKGKKDNINYGQHMLVERARYRSSSESSSEEDGQRQKSRFQIVNNAKKNSRGRHSQGSSDEDDTSLQMENTDDYDEQSDEPKRNINNDDAESDEPPKEVSESSDESEENSKEQETDENVFYLQGSRLQKPNFKSRYIKKDRRSFREPQFMPKRYKWDDNMLTHLDEYWTLGIKSYDTYRPKYEKLWPYRYFK